MSMCDRCIHGEVCGLEDNHEEAIVYCKNMIPIDVLDEIKRDIFNACCDNYHMPVHKLDCDEIFDIIDKYKAETE